MHISRSSIHIFLCSVLKKMLLTPCKLTLFTLPKRPQGIQKQSNISFGFFPSCPAAFQVSEMKKITNRFFFFFLPDSIMSVNNLLLPINKQKAQSLHSHSPKMLLICSSVVGSLTHGILFDLMKS